jgi:hypothetical protein
MDFGLIFLICTILTMVKLKQALCLSSYYLPSFDSQPVIVLLPGIYLLLIYHNKKCYCHPRILQTGWTTIGIFGRNDHEKNTADRKPFDRNCYVGETSVAHYNQPPLWQDELEPYLQYHNTITSGKYMVQRTMLASNPRNFNRNMSKIRFGESAYYQTNFRNGKELLDQNIRISYQVMCLAAV